MADSVNLTREEAVHLPLEMRVAAYGLETGLDSRTALLYLAEWGLLEVLKARLLEDPGYRVPYYLWASWGVLQGMVADEKEAPHG